MALVRVCGGAVRVTCGSTRNQGRLSCGGAATLPSAAGIAFHPGHPAAQGIQQYLEIPVSSVVENLECVPSGSMQSGFRIENHMHRYAGNPVAEAPLVAYRLYKIRALQTRQDARRNTATEIETASGKHLQSQVADHPTQNAHD
jgi:hypothetical protein